MSKLNVSTVDLSSTDQHLLIEELRSMIKLRNQTCSAMWWNICNDDANSIANRLNSLGLSREAIAEALKIKEDM